MIKCIFATMKILTILICLISFNLSAKELVYNITSSGLSIGQIKVNKVFNNGLVKITAKSDVKVDLFVTLDVSYSLNSTYKNNELLNSTVITFVNGKEHSKTITKKVDNYYLITNNNDSKKISHPILYSGSLLYFIPPNQHKTVYSEIDGIEKSIKEISNLKFQITNPINEHTSIYEYKNNVAYKITIHHTLLTFTLTLINS